MFNKILIANRGEIALRIHRTCQDMGIKTVAIHSTADENAMHVKLADESVCIGPPQIKDSYLNIPSIISAATIANVDAVHPGVGLLSENSEFAKIVNDHGYCFIGPKYEHLAVMGDKIEAKKMAKKIGLPILPGSTNNIKNLREAIEISKNIGFPLLIKATKGGGGRGIKKVFSSDDLELQFSLAKSEAKNSFGDDSVYIERYLTNPRHIEIQIIADNHGNVIHIGERDCSIQRRSQKILEECPSPALNDDERSRIYEISVKAMENLKYQNLGTIEYLYENGEFYFIEMNTRLQVEHPVSEIVYGIDIVKEQIRVASGKKISFVQDDIKKYGHSIECRINAENPKNFYPSSGLIKTYHVPGGPGIRVDSALYSGLEISNYYDGLIAKLIIQGRDRTECLMRLRRALIEFVIEGIDTTIPLHKSIIEKEEFINGEYDINWLEKNI
ncbi:MAG: acetyl-CoA carboxylase biotin carboxylase subunit [Rickettsiales bacterium]|nr:acetyl-CoA carboxylase biotin carboxylase subunit [Rickettsiales bacterium]OUV52921.1 MAG: acetyl-CoA carboxylase biotin carboxylase subunit [Rickettsiales bacterium TMED127]|tara:strand:+ start:6287 stop:7618 length:1332 start_codon:yes stop_codon:yes gene_type:complete